MMKLKKRRKEDEQIILDSIFMLLASRFEKEMEGEKGDERKASSFGSGRERRKGNRET